MPEQTFRNTARIACVIAFLSIAPAYAFIEQIETYVPAAEKIGEGRMTYMFWDIYDAALYAPNGAWQEDKPYALKISYLRNLDGEKIADRSVQEIRGQGFTDEDKLATWHAQMRKIFPDVSEGTSLTGVNTGTGETVFYKDNIEIGRIEDEKFSRAFFGIWLNEKTSAPSLRRKLLGAL